MAKKKTKTQKVMWKNTLDCRVMGMDILDMQKLAKKLNYKYFRHNEAVFITKDELDLSIGWSKRV